jgi:hypothetical protein
MDPRTLFPILSLVFFALAAFKGWKARSFESPVSTWALMGAIFGLVSLWLHLAR